LAPLFHAGRALCSLLLLLLLKLSVVTMELVSPSRQELHNCSLAVSHLLPSRLVLSLKRHAP